MFLRKVMSKELIEFDRFTPKLASFKRTLFSIPVMSCGSDKKIYLGELQA